jgi:hypothetical protein
MKTSNKMIIIITTAISATIPAFIAETTIISAGESHEYELTVRPLEKDFDHRRTELLDPHNARHRIEHITGIPIPPNAGQPQIQYRQRRETPDSILRHFEITIHQEAPDSTIHQTITHIKRSSRYHPNLQTSAEALPPLSPRIFKNEILHQFSSSRQQNEPNPIRGIWSRTPGGYFYRQTISDDIHHGIIFMKRYTLSVDTAANLLEYRYQRQSFP